jgi:hypothetical protein
MPEREPPSPRALLYATIAALVVAILLFVAVVLPAEYGVDPTGIGRPLGLTRMGEIKRAAAEAAEMVDAAARAIGTSSPAGYAPSPAEIESARDSAAVQPRSP